MTDDAKRIEEINRLLFAAKNMDWQQVVFNGGPPCFHLQKDGRFCGRAQRWDGHDEHHKFVPLDALLSRLESAETELEMLREFRQAALEYEIWNDRLWALDQGGCGGYETYEQALEEVPKQHVKAKTRYDMALEAYRALKENETKEGSGE